MQELFEALEREPTPALVFIRYPPDWSAERDLTYNDPDLAHAKVIRALDLGPRNGELRRLFPARSAFLLDLARQRLEPLP